MNNRICGLCKKEIPFVIGVILVWSRDKRKWLVYEAKGKKECMDGKIFCGPGHASAYAWNEHKIIVEY